MKISVTLVSLVLLCQCPWPGSYSSPAIAVPIAIYVAQNLGSYAIFEICDRIFQSDSDTEELKTNLLAIGTQIQGVEARLQFSTKRLLTLVQRSTLDRQLNDLALLMSQISAQETTLRNHLQNYNSLNRDTLKKFAEWSTSPNTDAMQALLDRVHSLVTGSDDLRRIGTNSLFEEMASYFKSHPNELCHTQKSAKQLLSSLAKAVLLTELKGHMVMHFSWIQREKFEGLGSFTRERQSMLQRFDSRTRKALNASKDVVGAADGSVFVCEPASQVKGITYEKMEVDPRNSFRSDNHISLKEELSNIQENMIVTGVRLRIVNHFIHLQIEQGRLEPDSFINNSSMSWKSLQSVHQNSRPNIDYFSNRDIYWELDPIKGRPGHALTGVRFVSAKIGDKHHVSLEGRMTKFDPRTGKLQTANSYWQSRDRNNLGKQLRVLTSSDILLPITVYEITIPDLERKYFEPFLELQEVIVRPAAPLSGVELFFNIYGETGGYVTPRVFTYSN